MDGGLTRRGFLRAGARAPASTQRAPWAVAESLFRQLCTRCGTCLSVCPKRILVRGEGTYPAVDFGRDGCTFCEKCVDACTEGALSKAIDPPWTLKAAIGETCLDLQGVTCRACADFCEPGAIRFTPMTGGRAQPRVRRDACTGCGACVSRCPIRVIAIGPGANLSLQTATHSSQAEGAILADQPLHPL